MILKSKIIFKINIFKLIEKYPKLMRSSVTLTFLKNYLKDIKKVCEENLREFQWVKVICLRKLLKLSLQKCLDKLFCKCCKIFKAYVTSRRVNFILTHFSSLTAKLILLIFLNVFLLFFDAGLYHINCQLIYRKNQWDLAVCDRDMQLRQIRVNMIDVFLQVLWIFA